MADIGSTALIAGASSGFGKAICDRLLGDGYRIIAVGRRGKDLQQLREAYGNSVFPLVLDVRDKEAVSHLKESLPSEFQSIDTLVNNAGLALGLEYAQDAIFDDWQTMIDTNVTGLACITHAVLPDMVSRQKGLVINMGSVAGTWPYPGGNVYGATKAFVSQFSRNLRADLAGTGVRVTVIEPGLCGGTEFSAVRFRGDLAKAAEVYKDVDPITPFDIADTVGWICSLPQHVNINSIEIMPTAQSFNPLKVTRKSST